MQPPLDIIVESGKHIKFHDFIFMVRSSSNENVQVMLQNIGKYTKYKRLIWFSVSHNTGFAHIPAASLSHLWFGEREKRIFCVVHFNIFQRRAPHQRGTRSLRGSTLSQGRYLHRLSPSKPNQTANVSTVCVIKVQNEVRQIRRCSFRLSIEGV